MFRRRGLPLALALARLWNSSLLSVSGTDDARVSFLTYRLGGTSGD